MKRLVWNDANGVRSFGCAGCRWTFSVKEFTPGFSETEVREEFLDHDCDDPRFRPEDNRSLPLPRTAELTSPPVNTSQVLQDLCGLQGAVLAAIEALASPTPSGDLAAIKAELDSVRSLLWLHLHASQETPVPDHHPQSPSATPQKRRWRRYGFDLPVTITTSTGKRLKARGTDLSEGGITVHAETPLTLGDELRVVFTPPFSNAEVKLPVVVRNQVGNRYGMEFLGSSGAELQEVALLRMLVKMLEARVNYCENDASKL